MIHAILTPSENNIMISIPNEYIGKEIEILLFAKYKPSITKPKVTITNFCGFLFDNSASEMHLASKESRNNWE